MANNRKRVRVCPKLWVAAARRKELVEFEGALLSVVTVEAVLWSRVAASRRAMGILQSLAPGGFRARHASRVFGNVSVLWGRYSCLIKKYFRRQATEVLSMARSVAPQTSKGVPMLPSAVSRLCGWPRHGISQLLN